MVGHDRRSDATGSAHPSRRPLALPALFVAPNFAIGAVLMMRSPPRRRRWLPRAEIVELHHESKADAPSGTARATAELLPGRADRSTRSACPVSWRTRRCSSAAEGQLLTIRHDAISREAYVPGVLLALDRLPTLPPGLTVGLETLLDGEV